VFQNFSLFLCLVHGSYVFDCVTMKMNVDIKMNVNLSQREISVFLFWSLCLNLFRISKRMLNSEICSNIETVSHHLKKYSVHARTLCYNHFHFEYMVLQNIWGPHIFLWLYMSHSVLLLVFELKFLNGCSLLEKLILYSTCTALKRSIWLNIFARLIGSIFFCQKNNVNHSKYNCW